MKLFVAAVLFITGTSAHAVECSKNKPEKFADFLHQFSTDQGFSVTRTVFPLRILRWEYGLNAEGKDASAPMKSSVLKPEYLQWQMLASYMASNGMTSGIDSQTQTSAVLRVGKPYTDWTMLYHFRLRKGCWFFWKYENQSL